MNAPPVTVVVPARDAERTLPLTLAGLGEQDGSLEVIVVDNGSRDGTAELASRAPVVSRVISRERGEGPGAARNAGAEAAAGSVIAFLDADCRPAPGWLAAGVRALDGADLVQGRVLPDPSVALGPFDRTLSVGAAHGLFETANLFVRREVFERAGGFGAGLEPSGGAPFGEDVIFGWRAVRAGARTGFCADALVYHEVSARGAGDFVAERARLALFPALAAAVPELREGFFYRRVFLSPRSAGFDLAVAGAALGAVLPSRRVALAAAAPYLLLLAREARRWGLARAPVVAAAGVAADAVGAAALARGSVRARSLVL
ncbi:MAG TPA: glycosyltransferase [Solirubrobacteraceae bacterium]|jgi:glycosyltransferase involved in cell wall biosynthesis|nr:glycosyltransferase [Solirubrobacteraceae bacterium]